MPNDRKPSGFWTKDYVVKDLMTMYAKGEADLKDTALALQTYCAEQNVGQSLETIEADVKWYARAVRKDLGLPSLKETNAIAKAQAEITEQAV